MWFARFGHVLSAVRHFSVDYNVEAVPWTSPTRILHQATRSVADSKLDDPLTRMLYTRVSSWTYFPRSQRMF